MEQVLWWITGPSNNSVLYLRSLLSKIERLPLAVRRLDTLHGECTISSFPRVIKSSHFLCIYRLQVFPVRVCNITCFKDSHAYCILAPRPHELSQSFRHL